MKRAREWLNVGLATVVTFVARSAKAEPVGLGGTVLCRDKVTGKVILQKNVLVQIAGAPATRSFTNESAGYYYIPAKRSEVEDHQINFIFGLGSGDVEPRTEYVFRDNIVYYNSSLYVSFGARAFERNCSQVDGHLAVDDTRIQQRANVGFAADTLNFIDGLGLLISSVALASENNDVIATHQLPVHSVQSWPTRVDLIRDSRTVEAPFPGFRVNPGRNVAVSVLTAPAAIALEDGWSVATNSELRVVPPYYVSGALMRAWRGWGFSFMHILGADEETRSATFQDQGRLNSTSSLAWRIDQLFAVSVSRRVLRNLSVAISPMLSIASEQYPTSVTQTVYSDGYVVSELNTSFCNYMTPDIGIGTVYDPIPQLRLGLSAQNIVGTKKNVGSATVSDRDFAVGVTSFLGRVQLGVDGDYSFAYGGTFTAGSSVYVFDGFEVGGGYVSTFHSWRARITLFGVSLSLRHGSDGWTTNVGGNWRF